MILKAGDLDRRVRIERREARGGDILAAGERGWTLVDEVWAQVQDVLPSRAEKAGDAIDIGRRPARVRMRWRDDVTGDMRLVVEGREIQIVSGPVEIGRREGLEMMAEAYSSEGGRP